MEETGREDNIKWILEYGYKILIDVLVSRIENVPFAFFVWT
jgi:hypothetical protein